MVDPGFAVWDYDPAVAAWAKAARGKVAKIDTSVRRHGETWFVGVDALDNATDGSVGGVPWPHAAMAPAWHRAQVSIVYPGYPKQGADEPDAAHAFRMRRDAAHMDGLLPEGSRRRRHLREPHAFILGVPLNAVVAAPLVVWPGSHLIMGAAFRRAFDRRDPADWGNLDVTDIYQAARREVFDTCDRVAVPVAVGQTSYLHRHLIHGVAPWGDMASDEGRMIAYFRPLLRDVRDWL